jgi:hypothetical protein
MPDWRRWLRDVSDRLDATTLNAANRYRTRPHRAALLALVWVSWTIFAIVLWLATNPSSFREGAITVGVLLFVLYLGLLAVQGTVKQAKAAELAEVTETRWIERSHLPRRVREVLLPPDEDHPLPERVMYITRAHPTAWISKLPSRWPWLLLAAFGIVAAFVWQQPLALVFVIAIAPVYVDIWEWARDYRVLTDRRAIRVWGVFHSEFGEMNRPRLVSIAATGTFAGKLLCLARIIQLEYAHLTNETAAEKEALRVQGHMPEPNKYQQLARIAPDMKVEPEPETVPDGT